MDEIKEKSDNTCISTLREKDQYIAIKVSVLAFILFLAVPLSVKLVILDPQVEESDVETVVEPLQMITFECDAKGRPAPQISYTWLPFNETESGQVCLYPCHAMCIFINVFT